MSTSVTDLKGIAASGGGLVLDANKFTTTELKSIAASANGAIAQITLKNLQSKSVTDMKSIASCGGGKIIFDFT